MKTYAYTKDWRIKLYIAVLSISVIIYVLIDYFLLSKISVRAEFAILVKLSLSIVSVSGINAGLLWIIGAICTKTNKLNGVYRVQLTSNYNEKTIEGTMTIKIGLQRAKVILKTGTSESQSETVFIENDDKDRIVITYTYRNEGNHHEKNKLAMHNGTGMLTFENGTFVDGKYYNDEHRRTFGKITQIGTSNASSNQKAN